jgi:hypothetical protein
VKIGKKYGLYKKKKTFWMTNINYILRSTHQIKKSEMEMTSDCGGETNWKVDINCRNSTNAISSIGLHEYLHLPQQICEIARLHLGGGCAPFMSLEHNHVWIRSSDLSSTTRHFRVVDNNNNNAIQWIRAKCHLWHVVDMEASAHPSGGHRD